jgi:hypothetical protein
MMTKEEIRQAAQDWDGSGLATPAEEGAFIAGAEWMQERMQESNEGQALLYAVEKTAERTRKETLLEVLNWIEGMYDTDYVAGDIVRMLKDKLKKK